MFSDAKKCPSTHHNSPAIHHNFTTKNHIKNTLLPENPCKNATPPHDKKILNLCSDTRCPGHVRHVHIAQSQR
jgi:hypothetical protein